MKTLKEFLAEGKKDYEIYHKSYSASIEEMMKYVKKNGYDVDVEGSDFFNQVTTGGKPSIGKTKRHKIPLMKNSKTTKKKVIFQVYGMPKGSYELNMYIS